MRLFGCLRRLINEAESTEVLHSDRGDIPYVWLTKLPLFRKVPGGMQPIPGTYDGLPSFYLE
jgi:hypothetical protein